MEPQIDGFLGGGHIGYNIQNADVVFGIVGDVNLSSLHGDKTRNVGTPFTVDVDVDMTASVRGRFGVLVTDRVMIYATGGLAIADVEHEVRGQGRVWDLQKTFFGFTAGGGADVAVTDWISAFVEYRYTQYGDESWPDIFNSGLTLSAHDLGFETHQVQGGVSFHFNSWLSGGP